MVVQNPPPQLTNDSFELLRKVLKKHASYNKIGDLISDVTMLNDDKCLGMPTSG